MIEILRKMFEANPEKSTIVLNDKCSECGRKTIIEVTPTSGGYGLMGGVLFKTSNGKSTFKCSACFGKNFKKDEDQKNIKRPMNKRVSIKTDNPAHR